MHFKIICLFTVLMIVGCSTDSLKTSSELQKKIVLKEEQSCINSAQKILKSLMKNNRVFLSNELFKNSSTLIISTQYNVESPIKQHQISKEFRLKQENKKCYIEEIELFKVINREEISCKCLKS